ncbi:hypothetical protein DFH29DRAFT_963902, partial [Suillus ampliporus]
MGVRKYVQYTFLFCLTALTSGFPAIIGAFIGSVTLCTPMVQLISRNLPTVTDLGRTGLSNINSIAIAIYPAALHNSCPIFRAEPLLQHL